MKINWDSFWDRVELIPFHSCWEWIGYKTNLGYGQYMALDRKKFQAHRASFFFHVGKLNPALVLDHTCRNKLCVNPRHLREVPQRINNTENSVGVAALNIQKTMCPRGHVYDKFRKNKSREIPARACRTCDNINKKKSYFKRKSEGKKRKRNAPN